MATGSSGPAAAAAALSPVVFFLLLLDGRMRGSLQPCARPPPPPTRPDGERTSAGLTEHRSERSKSESMMWPPSLTSTFSGFRSLYTTPSMCRYSSASNTSDA
uniref:Uncharacterized protein n=1 Tax=Arundo donax TaxID=35708 RepID=A0A0A8Z7L1_ARUDO